MPKFVADILELGDRTKGFKWLKSRYIYGAGDTRGELVLDLSRSKKEEDKPVDAVMVTHYHKELLSSERGQAYLESRKLTQQTWERFGLGYDREHDSIIIPIIDEKGLVVMLKGRSVEGKSFHNTKGSKRANVVFGLAQLLEYGNEDEPVWVCESETDCMTVWEYGGQAIAIMGSSLSEEQARILAGTRYRKYIDGFDRDDAGRKGLRRFKDMTIKLGFRIWNTKDFGGKKDINELSKTEFQTIKNY